MQTESESRQQFANNASEIKIDIYIHMHKCLYRYEFYYDILLFCHIPKVIDPSARLTSTPVSRIIKQQRFRERHMIGMMNTSG